MEESVNQDELSLEQKFAQSTNLHGVAKLADKSKPALLRVAWFLAFGACMGVCGWQIFLRIHDYLQFGVRTKVSRINQNELEFPAVTICNFNRYRSSEVTENDLSYISYALSAEDYNYDSYADGKFDDDSFDYYDYGVLFANSSFNYTEFTLRAGFVLNDETLWDCKWRGRNCSAENFTHVFTSYGNCWTFNTGGNEAGNELPTLAEDQPGSGNGLKVTLNIQQEEYTETLSGNIQAGVKVLVHDQEDPPLMDSQGSAIPPGYYAFVSIKREDFDNLEPPWGDCDKSKTLQYYWKYSLSGCFIECKLKHIVRECGCRPVRYPGNAVICNPWNSSTCVKDVLRRFKTGALESCYCPVPCKYSEFTTSISYGSIPNLSVANGTSVLYNASLNYLRRNLVIVDIYYEKLNFQSYKESKALTISILISDIGGSLGLFLGGSILTVAELIEYILMKCRQLCHSEKRRKPATNNSTAPIFSAKIQEGQQSDRDNCVQLGQY